MPDHTRDAQEFKLGQYMTPAWAARELWDAHFGDADMADAVLEPTCGDGRMLQAVPDYIPACGVEIDPTLAATAARRTDRPVITGDVLSVEIPHRFNIVFGNPPFRAGFLDRLLARLATLMEDGCRCGFIVPAYFMQTPSRVLRWNRSWSIAAELLPRTLFPRLSKPIIFALFTKDPVPNLSGMRLFVECAAMDDLKPAVREELTKGRRLWFVVVDRALAELGGQASLPQIYAAVAVKRPTSNQWWREKVRQTLQRRFVRVRRGVWDRRKAA